MTADSEPLYDTESASVYLGIARVSVDRLVRDGKLKIASGNGPSTYRFTKSALDARIHQRDENVKKRRPW